jgi:Flp pilus assembly protein TadG
MRKPFFIHLAETGFGLPAAIEAICAFRHSTKAIAAVEFAIVLPVMLVVALGSVETARLMTFSQRINLVANTAVQMLSQTPQCTTSPSPCVPSNLTGTTVGYVAYTDLHTAQDSAMVIFPQVLQDASQKGISWSSDIQISMSSVRFVATNPSCTTSCTYQAHVVWYSGPNPRPCGTNLTSAADNATPSATTLPQGLFPTSSTAPTALYAGSSLLVVDVAYTYTPLFTSKLFGAISMHRSAYMAPRYIQLVLYNSSQSGNDGIGNMCSTY